MRELRARRVIAGGIIESFHTRIVARAGKPVACNAAAVLESGGGA